MGGESKIAVVLQKWIFSSLGNIPLWISSYRYYYPLLGFFRWKFIMVYIFCFVSMLEETGRGAINLPRSCGHFFM